MTGDVNELDGDVEVFLMKPVQVRQSLYLLLQFTTAARGWHHIQSHLFPLHIECKVFILSGLLEMLLICFLLRFLPDHRLSEYTRGMCL